MDSERKAVAKTLCIVAEPRPDGKGSEGAEGYEKRKKAVLRGSLERPALLGSC